MSEQSVMEFESPRVGHFNFPASKQRLPDGRWVVVPGEPQMRVRTHDAVRITGIPAKTLHRLAEAGYVRRAAVTPNIVFWWPQEIEELIAQHLRQIFANASFFTLKRVLGDEVLKVLDEMKSDPKLRAQWYATQVVRMMEYQVNFGLALRNRPDFIFHRGWAETVSPDRLCWELLNREHRLLNQAQNGAGL